MNTTLFDPKKRKMMRQRAQARFALRNGRDSGFLHTLAAQIIAERLSATNRKFENAALLFSNPFAQDILNTITDAYPELKGGISIVDYPELLQQANVQSEALNLEPQSIDLAISIFDLHWMNDLPGMLVQINRALKPDGLLMAVLPGEGTLSQLNECLIGAEIAHRSGATVRLDAFPQIRQIGDLLSRAGFKLPVADLESREIRYSEPAKLVADLRNVAGGNSRSETGKSLTGEIWADAVELYKKRFASGDGKIIATINLVFLSGWKEHESQQKPLKRGSAEQNLKDFL